LKNGGNSPPKKIGYIINNYFKISNKWIMFIMTSNIKLKKFQKKIDVGFVYVFKVGIIIITLKCLFTRNNLFSLKFVISNFWNFFLFNFFLEFALFVSIFFPKNIVKLGKFTTRKMCWLLGGAGGVV